MRHRKHIVLTGFMGTGKSTVGPLVAERLGLPFVDLDLLLEEREGLSISAFFAQCGEPEFRRRERELLDEVLAGPSQVITTGGGTLLTDEARAAAEECAEVYCLFAPEQELVARLREDDDRPLLDAEEGIESRVRSLWKVRRDRYHRHSHRIATGGRCPSEVADAILRIHRLFDGGAGRSLEVQVPGATYPVLVSRQLRQHMGRVLQELGFSQATKVAIVTNTTVGPLYARPLCDLLEAAGHVTSLHTLEDGEVHKTLESISQLYDGFLDAGLDRTSVVIGLGGGVVCDMAGFAAATFMRGIASVLMPTSLLAMVDASVGGKTGVDYAGGKNLVGAFHHPRAVCIDPEVLETLASEEFSCGLAEAIKHAVIDGKAHFERFERFERDALRRDDAWICDAIRVKVEICEEDPYEGHRRKLLNLGHTFGHAIETVSAFSIRHGEAVSIGMVAAFVLAEDLGWIAASLTARLRQLLRGWGLPVVAPGLSVDEIVAAMSLDKKKKKNRLVFLVPAAIGDVRITDLPTDSQIRRAIEAVTQV